MLFRVTPNRFFHEDIKLMSSELCRTQRHHTTDVKIKKAYIKGPHHYHSSSSFYHV